MCSEYVRIVKSGEGKGCVNIDENEILRATEMCSCMPLRTSYVDICEVYVNMHYSPMTYTAKVMKLMNFEKNVL